MSETTTKPEAVAAPDDDQTVKRGRPGRRTAQNKAEAVLRLLAGKASVDQIARELGVRAATVESWRETALEGIQATLAAGEGKSERERALEKQVRELQDTLQRATIERAVALKAIEEWKRSSRPSRPGRSPR
jgi:transposase-like protein